MRVDGFGITTDGKILVLYRDGYEEGYYPISVEDARVLIRQLQQAVGDAQLINKGEQK